MTGEAVDSLSHDSFPYSHPVIGSMADLNAATLDDIRSFFTTCYAPNNAVLSVSGDFDEKTIVARIEKYFGSIAAQKPPAAVDPAEAPIAQERRKTLTDSFAAQPMLTLSYRTVPAATPSWYALEVASSVLGDGESSRLYKLLVKEKQLATAVYCNLEESRGASLFSIKAILRKDASMKDVEDAVAAELARLQKDPPKSWEMEKAENGALAQTASDKQTALGRAITSAIGEAMFNDPAIDFLDAQRVARVTPADVVSAAATYLAPSERVVVETNVESPKATHQKETGK